MQRARKTALYKGKCPKIQLFSFCSQNKMLVIMAGIHKMLVRIANREDPDQTVLQKQSDLCIVCLCLFDRHLVFKILEHLLNIY